ncbi:hypothetical protein CEE37_01770 [candidate division LCP-89 bacterium B3_LCP]|uniref:T9SS C-terminal target domain-containing protein n=1 Tax=candidate division LCP-89 bacterium B3_LCP TaxID=2012998 RepID=A0A532V5F0_UNCL8|nr:MAG: hypothetical protein CEE37_01770 [candidate division LCP-89 bacterium B3_LCP]
MNNCKISLPANRTRSIRRGTMNRTILSLSLIIVLSLTAATASASRTTQIYYFEEPEVVTVNGQTTVIMANTTNWGDIGDPLLPQAPVQLLLPPGEEAAKITVKTAQAVIIGDGYRIPHRQQPYRLSEGPTDGLTPRNEGVYSTNNPFPVERSGRLQTQFLSGHSIAFAAIFPVSYRPVSGELSYYPWIEVTAESQPTRKAQTSHTQLLKRTRSVQERVADLVHNPHAVPVYGPQAPMDPEGWDMLLITIEDYVDDYQEYVDFKNSCGILTTVVTAEDIYTSYPGVDTAEMIRNCIIEYYTTYGISYVFLCGDVDWVSHRGLWCMDDHIPADLYYAGLDGNWNNDGDEYWGEPGEEDLTAEVFVGRCCADAEFMIDNVINKHLMYQTEPVIGEIETGLTVGEDLGWNSWGWQYQEEIRLGTSNWYYTTVGFPNPALIDTLYDRPDYSWSAYYDLIPKLNTGPALVSHLGHCSEYYLMKLNLGMINDYNFTNDGINHNFWIGYSQGCYPAAFDYNYPDCLVEQFVALQHGPIAYVANSRYGYGDYNTTNGPSQHFNRQYIDAIFAEDISLIGITSQDSKEDNIWMVGDSFIRWCYYELNLFGDPTLDFWTSEPGTFLPNYSSVAIVGSQVFEVNGISVEGALVTISQDGVVLGMAETNASGIATVNFSAPLIGQGFIDLVITAHDMIPYMDVVEIIASEYPYIIYASCDIEDEIIGNGNGQLDYSESVELTMTVENVGTNRAGSVDLTISCEDPLMSITDSTANLPGIEGGALGTVNNAFALEIGPDIEDGHAFAFTLTATDGDSVWTSPFSIIGHAPEVEYDQLVIEDPTGNYDNHLDPGETADFHIDVTNEGSADAPELGAVLSCDEPLISIPQNTANLAILEAGAQTTLIFADLLADAEVGQGDTVNFLLEISAQGGYTCSHEFYIVVGDIRYAPVGPDAYGYYAYDSYDGTEAPVFDWVEIAPGAGGVGIDLEMGEYQLVSLELPFTFSYYGVDYDTVNVSSDGWLSLGTPSVFPPANFAIPHFTPPNNLVAAFWDATLDPSSSGQVCCFYDEENHRYIAEWWEIPHSSSPSDAETFQIILFDPEYYPTITGDGEIQVNYQSLSSMISNCTVGIENSDGTDGIQFLYNTVYNQTAMPLENSFALKYTTGSENQTTVNPESNVTKYIPADFGLGQNHPNPFNPSTNISFALPEASPVTLTVFNLQGSVVTELVNGWRDAGVHEVTFDASNLASGLYFYRIQAGNFTGVKKMMLVK